MGSSPAPSVMYHSIAVDSDDSEYDNYFVDGGITSTAASLASQVTDYKFVHGRRYHAYRNEGANAYWAPNDETQSEQLELFHHVYVLRLHGELYLAPIGDNPHMRILDLGTGTGIWCIDMANLFPEATIIGNDLSPIQPTYVPPNVQFEIDDFTDEWVHPPDYFDFIHGRALYGSVKNWNQLLQSAFKALKPGGWFESVETYVELISDDNSLPEDSILPFWAKSVRDAAEASGATFNVPGHVKGWCEDVGFVEVEQKVFKIPMGPWPKDKYEKTIGSFNLANMLTAAEGFSLHLLTNFGGYTYDEFERLMVKVKAALKNKSHHTYFRLVVCYARKPESFRPPSPSDASTIRAPSTIIDWSDEASTRKPSPVPEQFE